jgi:chitinase
MNGCADGETEVTQNTNHHSDTEDQSCTGGLQSYCCLGFKPPITKEQAKDKLKDEAKDFVLEQAEALALEVLATTFCRIAITAALTPLTFIPFIGRPLNCHLASDSENADIKTLGWIVRLAVQAAVPALAKLCAKGVAKGGKSVFKFQGKDYDVKLDKPLSTKVDRAPSNSPTRPPENTDRPSGTRGVRTRSITSSIVARAIETVIVKTCVYSLHSQACLHYSSVISRRPGLQSMTCINNRGVGGHIREVLGQWNLDHDRGWINGWMRSSTRLGCQRDEWPPAAIWQGRDKNVWIRLSPQKGNNLAGQLFAKVCPSEVRTEVVRTATFHSIKRGKYNKVSTHI